MNGDAVALAATCGNESETHDEYRLKHTKVAHFATFLKSKSQQLTGGRVALVQSGVFHRRSHVLRLRCWHFVL